MVSESRRPVAVVASHKVALHKLNDIVIFNIK